MFSDFFANPDATENKRVTDMDPRIPLIFMCSFACFIVIFNLKCLTGFNHAYLK